MTPKQTLIGLTIAVGISLPSGMVLFNLGVKPLVQTATTLKGTTDSNSRVQLALAETENTQNDAKAERIEIRQSVPVNRGQGWIREVPVLPVPPSKPVSTETPVLKTKSIPAKASVPKVSIPLHGEFIGNFYTTGYTLSVASCGKPRSHKQYGVTNTSISLKGKNIQTKKIAVDPDRIPLHSKIYIVFPKEYRYVTLQNDTVVDLNGEYEAVDTGSAVQGNIIDLFFGEDKPGEDFYENLVDAWGSKKAKVYQVLN